MRLIKTSIFDEMERYNEEGGSMRRNPSLMAMVCIAVCIFAHRAQGDDSVSKEVSVTAVATAPIKAPPINDAPYLADVLPASETYSGSTQVTDIAVGDGKQANKQVVVMYRFSQNNYSTVESRNLALLRDDPDPSVSRSLSEALQGMKVGGKRRVTTPPIAGRRSFFEVELLDVVMTESELKPRTNYMTASEKSPTGPDPLNFFKGCSVKHGEQGRSDDQIRGTCLGHAFSDDGLSIPTPCQVSYAKSVGVWTVFNCNMDNRLIYSAAFRTDIAKLADVRYMSTAATVGITKRELLGPGKGPQPTLYPINQLASASEVASVPAQKNSEEDKQYCNGKVQKHLRLGGIVSGAGTVFSMCMNERLALAKGRLAVAEKEREEVEYKQQQLQKHLQEAAQICPAGAQPPSVAGSREPTMYGLAINMPIPCLRFCDDEPKRQKARICVRENSLRQTGWGTTLFDVSLNRDVFDGGETAATGLPSLEIADGKIVGMSFDDSSYPPQGWLQLLTKKFGKYQFRGNVYFWETSTSSARLVTETRTRYSLKGQVDLDHPFGEGIVGNDYDAAKFSVYVPAIRTRKEAFMTAEASKNRKEGF
jgi:hypothetical protein